MKVLIVFSILLLSSSLLHAAPFTDHGNGTVTDTKTGLMWEQNGSTIGTWETALSGCEALTWANYTDWRLPNKKELASIVDISTFNPSINATAFHGTVSSYYWSSTTYVPFTAYAWVVYFGSGSVVAYVKTDNFYVRCVRGGL